MAPLGKGVQLVKEDAAAERTPPTTASRTVCGPRHCEASFWGALFRADPSVKELLAHFGQVGVLVESQDIKVYRGEGRGL